MELDDSFRQSTNDLGHCLSDLVPPTLIVLNAHTWKYDRVYEWTQDVWSAPDYSQKPCAP